MRIVHSIARTMLAGYFLIDGVKAFRHPESVSDEAGEWARKALPTAKAVLPGALAAYLPADATGAIRGFGALRIAGSLALASGLGRRLGAGLLAATLVPQALAANPLGAPAAERSARFASLDTTLALLGGTVLAALDTEGKPTLAYRAKLHDAEAKARAASARRS